MTSASRSQSQFQSQPSSETASPQPANVTLDGAIGDHTGTTQATTPATTQSAPARSLEETDPALASSIAILEESSSSWAEDLDFYYRRK